MKIIYECEICGSHYHSHKAALHCESTVLEECPIKVGDEIFIKSRYNGIEKDVVTKVTIGAGLINEWVSNHSDEEFEEYLSRCNYKEQKEFHEYVLHTKEFHSLSKDDFDNKVGLHNLVR